MWKKTEEDPAPEEKKKNVGRHYRDRGNSRIISEGDIFFFSLPRFATKTHPVEDRNQTQHFASLVISLINPRISFAMNF